MIQVIERFHKILEYVALEPETPRTVTELANLIGVSTPACSNIIRTMVSLGYLQSLGKRKGYIMGATPFFLTRQESYKKYLADLARPFMKKLIEEINELVVLVTNFNGKRLELLKFEGNSLIQIRSSSTESMFSLFETATGAVLLAHMDEDSSQSLWDAFNNKERCIFQTNKFSDILNEYAAIREYGGYISTPKVKNHDDMMNKFATLAFPVFEKEKVVAAVGAMVPAYRFKDAHKNKVIKKCRNTAKIISMKNSTLKSCNNMN